MLLTLAVFLTAIPPGAPVADACGGGEAGLIARSTPDRPGPLRLKRVHCLRPPGEGRSTAPARPSPDGRHYFFYAPAGGLWVGAVDGDAEPRNLAGRLALDGIGYTDIPSFAWSARAGWLFGVRQATMRNGFALEPLAPLALSAAGKAEALPRFATAAARRLDGLSWVGDAGLAVAEFDNKGGYYRPERGDPRPSLAIVDARRGKILQLVAIPGLLGAKSTVRDIDTRVGDIDAQVEKGAVHALFRMGRDTWFDWRQGSRPVRAGLRFDSPISRFALAPGGRNVLVMNGLSASGMICEHNPACPSPTPASGAVAQLRDIRTGKVRWTLHGRAETFSNYERPAISPDGRHALVTLPLGFEGRYWIALVSMDDGRILQRMERPWSGTIAMGFGRDGKSAWTSGGTSLVTYTVGRTRQPGVRRASRRLPAHARRSRS